MSIWQCWCPARSSRCVCSRLPASWPLGVPQSARDVFELLARGGWIEASLAAGLKNMVGFRNIAVHEYQTLQLPITVAIITQHLDEFLVFSSTILRRDAGSPGD
ncbi:MAG: DUF86 domain-containing protein [Pseudomonas indica]|nr:DUF86 domain-containing protein [Pseudomonas indica]